MISLNLTILNPWSAGHFDNLWNRSWLPFKHKAIELEFLKYEHIILDFQFKFSAKCAHAGLQFEIGILGYCVSFNFYDTRHWDYTTNTWEIQND